jgi:hypothetical protein
MEWPEFVIKASRLLLRKHLMPRKYRRLPIRDSLDPLDQVELDNLGRWSGEDPFLKDKDPENVPLPFRELAVEELPPGFGFDEYGLLVLEKYAVTLPESRETNAAELPGPAPVGEVRPTDSNFERTVLIENAVAWLESPLSSINVAILAKYVVVLSMSSFIILVIYDSDQWWNGVQLGCRSTGHIRSNCPHVLVMAQRLPTPP